MNPYNDPTHIATVEQYKAALLAVRDQGGIWGKPLEMLKAHFRAPFHTRIKNGGRGCGSHAQRSCLKTG
jgi:hypothetical protein